jgi:hypothetical protein
MKKTNKSKLVYLYAMKFSFSWPKQEKYSLYIHNRFISQLSHLVNHVLISSYRSFWCIIDWHIHTVGGAYCTDIEID